MKPTKDLGPRWARRVEHDGDDADIVGPQVAHVPPLDGQVHQFFGRIDPAIIINSRLFISRSYLILVRFT